MNITKTQAKKICLKLGKEFVSCSFLAKGNHNSNFLLKTLKNKYVIRIEDNVQFKNLKKEYAFLKKAQLGLGPVVFLFDDTHKIISKDYLVEEFILGKHPSERRPTDHFVIQMAKWFRYLHTTTKKMVHPLSLMKEVEPYYQNYLKYKSHLSQGKMKHRLEECMKKGMTFLAKNDAIFGDRDTLSLLHNDTSSGNIFCCIEGVRLIDWEFVGYGLPERELVYFLDSYKLSTAQVKLFLRSYGYETSRKSLKAIRAMYVVLLFGSIGYSLWQLDILQKEKAPKKEEELRMKRLERDIQLLEQKLGV